MQHVHLLIWGESVDNLLVICAEGTHKGSFTSTWRRDSFNLKQKDSNSKIFKEPEILGYSKVLAKTYNNHNHKNKKNNSNNKICNNNNNNNNGNGNLFV